MLFLPALLCIFTGGKCLPLLDVKRHGCLDAIIRIEGRLPPVGCDGQVTDVFLTEEKRHQGLLEELQELVEHELKRENDYTQEGVGSDVSGRDDQKHLKQASWGHEEQSAERKPVNDEDEEESARELEELFANEIRKKEEARKADIELEKLRKIEEEKSENDKEEEDKERRENEVELTAEKHKVELELQPLRSDKRKTKERQEKEEELQELMQKMERVKEEQDAPIEADRPKEEKPTPDTKEPQQKREMENASDERTRQFEKERYSEEEEEEDEEGGDKDEEDDSEELLEIEAQLRKVAAELRKLHRG